ncbi:MAG: glycosyltransferase family 4 protein [Salinarimonas sp.]|nr:glycosyltransferase family 4 protein [Salinarimonas sp.]
MHQGYELYGSDRSFLETLETMRRVFPSAEIEAVLPQEGPLAAALRARSVSVRHERMWILRRRQLLRLMTLGLLELPMALMRAWRNLSDADILYINTCVVVDHLLAAGFRPKRVLVHVHEIPDGIVLAALRALLRWSRAEVLFNSRATQQAFALPDSRRQSVLYNGVAAPDVSPAPAFDGTYRLKLIQIGRLSHLKGQDVLIRAISLLPREQQGRVEVRIVGDAFENPKARDDLERLAQELGVAACVAFHRFIPDPSEHFEWADIVCVPSRLPESLGRVAIEAAGCGRVVIASDIGGLPEIVDHGRTGWLVEPGDENALAARIDAVLRHPDSWIHFPTAARARYEALFAPALVEEALAALLRRKVATDGESPIGGTFETRGTGT